MGCNVAYRRSRRAYFPHFQGRVVTPVSNKQGSEIDSVIFEDETHRQADGRCPSPFGAYDIEYVSQIIENRLAH
jgi:hypothetical protein